jgi:CHAT domain-containing protein
MITRIRPPHLALGGRQRRHDVKLITNAMDALAKDKSFGRAEALRRAMLSVMADTSRPANWMPTSHPSVWAPFVVVGEGGGGR